MERHGGSVVSFLQLLLLVFWQSKFRLAFSAGFGCLDFYSHWENFRNFCYMEVFVRVLSLGWGVQSWTLAAMSALGELPELDLAIHSDAGYERGSTYAFAAEQTPWLEERGVRVVVARPQNTADSGIRNNYGGTYVPAFTVDKRGKKGQVRRQCTGHWKIVPLQQVVRAEMKVRNIKVKPGVVRMWLGITTDEFHRAKDARVGYIQHEFPFLDMGFSRQDCLGWLRDHNLPVPSKSSCTFCPFHDDKAWQELKRAGGADWEEAVAADELLRDARLPGQLFVHRKAIPLVEAVILPEEREYVQSSFFDVDADAECDSGHCFI